MFTANKIIYLVKTGMKSELYSRLYYEFRNVLLVYERFNIGNIPESYATFLNGSRTLEFGLSDSSRRK